MGPRRGPSSGTPSRRSSAAREGMELQVPPRAAAAGGTEVRRLPLSRSASRSWTSDRTRSRASSVDTVVRAAVHRQRPGTEGTEGTAGAQPESRARCLRPQRLGRGTSSRISWADRGATAPRRASEPSGAEGSARTRTDSLPVRRWTATRVRTWSKRSAVAMAGTVRTEPAGRPAEVRVRSQPCGPSGWTEPGHFTITYSRT